MGLAKWWAALSLFLAVGVGANAQNQPATVELPESLKQFVVSPSSGVAAMLEEGRDGVALYPQLSSERSLAKGLLSPIVGKPIVLSHKPGRKGGLFVVADDQRTIYFLDDTTGKQLGSVKVDGDIIDIAAPANADADVVFYSTGQANHRDFSTKFIGRINVTTMKDEGFFEVGNMMSDHYIIEAAADGRTIYLARPHTSPTGIYALRRDESEPNRLNKIYDEHDSTPGYRPLADGMGTAIKQEVRTADLGKKLRQLPGRALVGMIAKPVVFCETDEGKSIAAVSLNTGRQISSVALEAREARNAKRNYQQVRRAMEQRGFSGMKQSVFIDELNQNLVVRKDGSAIIIALDAFHIPAEPRMVVKLDGSTDLAVNETWKATLKPAQKGITISLRNAPEGLKLEGSKLIWTPSAQNVGSARVTLELTAGELKTDQEFELIVRQRALKLPFWVANSAATPDGSKLIAVAGSGNQNRPDDPTQTSRIAVIDLVKGAVLFDKELDFKVSALDATDATIYLAAQQTDAIYSLAFADPQKINKTFTEGNVQGLLAARNRLYVSVTRRNGVGTVAYGLPAMEPIETPTPPANALFYGEQNALPVDVGAGWRVGEAVWSADFSKVLTLLEPMGFPGVYLRGNGPGGVNRMARWGTVLEAMQIRRLSGQVIAQTRDTLGGTLLVDLPAAVLLRVTQRYDGEKRMNIMQAEIALLDLVNGKEEKILLAREQQDPGRNNFDHLRFGRPQLVISRPGKILACVGDRLFVVPTKNLDPQRFPEPLAFDVDAKPVFLKGADPVKLNFKVRGGSGPLRFSLLQDAPGLEIDAASGQLSIEPAKVFSGERLDALLDAYAQMSRTEQGSGKTILELAAKQIEMAAYWAGKKPQGIPLVLRLGVRVRDANQQEAVLEHAYLVDMPAEMLQKRLEERLANGPKVNVPRPGLAAGNAASSDDVAVLKRRVQELELENARLKAQVEVLKEIRQSGATGRTN